MNANKFIEGLQVIVGSFESRAKKYGVISEDGVEIKVGRKFIDLRLVVDSDGDTIVCNQEVEMIEEGLRPLVFHARIF